ncbi:MAG: ABC transporter substrate-binding protein [Bauldia sp.]|nr:ABC transporter substrate-binding protein [Bauldia sp.]
MRFPSRPLRGLLLALGSIVAVMSVQPAFGQAMRTVTDDTGREVAIPVDPQRIVSLRGEQITAPLLELGANLVGAGGVVSPAINGGQPYVRGAFDILDFRFEASTIAFVGGDNDFDIEAIAALRPDLIIAPAVAAATDRLPQLEAIAPTVLLIFATNDPRLTGGNTSLERYRRVADWAGRLEQFNALEAAFADRLARYRTIVEATLGDPARVVVSHIDNHGVGTYQVLRHYDMLTEMIDALGFAYPAIVAEATGPSVAMSAELLPQLQTDFLISTFRSASENDYPDAIRARFDETLPGWQEFVHAAKYGQHIFIDREQMRTATFASARYVLDFLMANIVLRPFTALGEATLAP